MENQDIRPILEQIQQDLALYKKAAKQEEAHESLTYAVLHNDVSYIKTEIKEIKTLIENKYVTSAEFQPIKNVVYGMVGLILVTVVGGLLTLVLRK